MRISAAFLLLPVLVHSQTSTGTSTSLRSTLITSTTSSPTIPKPSSLVEIWIPIQTILNPTTAVQHTSSTPAPNSPDLELREIVAAAGPQVLPNGATQVSPVTTILEQHWVNGIPTPIQIIYSQSFAAVPDQLPGPMSGSIGMGNIKGQIGVTNRVVARAETALPKAKPLRARSGTEKQAQASGAIFALLVLALVVMIL